MNNTLTKTPTLSPLFPSTRAERRRDRSGNNTIEFPMLPLSDPEGRVERCHNLRPTRSGRGRLEGVGRPVELFPDLLPGAFFVPGGVFSHSDGSESLLLCRDGELFVSRGGAPVSLGTLGADATVAVALTNGWTVMNPAGPAEVRFSGGVWGIVSSSDQLPRLTFERLDGTTFSGQTVKLTSMDTFTAHSSSVSFDDARSIGFFLTDTYHDIAALARSSHQYIQPVIARYRLLDAEGKVIYTSAPVMISPEGGLQLSKVELPLTGSPCHTIDTTTISAKGFTLGLRVACSPSLLSDSPVKRIEIQVSPELHPIFRREISHCRVVGRDNGNLVIRAWLPGLSEWRRPGEPGGAIHSRIARLLSRLDSSLTTVASVPLPTSAGEAVQVCPYPDSDCDIEDFTARFLQLTATEPVSKRRDDDLVEIRPPHTFTATAGARCGEVVLWGGVTMKPFDGYSLDEFTVRTSLLTGGGTPTAVAVTMDDRAVAVRSTTMASLTPERVSPLLVYPSGQATKMTLLTPGSRTVCNLSQTPCGTLSFHLDPDLAPVALSGGNSEGFAVPAATVGSESWPDLLAIASARSPLRPLTTARCGHSAISVIAPVPAAGSALDMSRVKFYAFAAGGISLVTCRPGQIASLSLLSGRGVSSPSCVAATSDALAVLAGGVPFMLTGQKFRRIGPEGLSGELIGWNPLRDEIWILTHDSLEAVVMKPNGSGRHTRTVEQTDSLLTTPSGLFMLTASGHAVDGSRETDQNVRFDYRVRIPSTCRPGLFYRLIVRLAGTVLGTGIVLRSDCGLDDPEAGPLLSRQFDGQIRHPFMTGFHAVHSHYLTLGVGAVTPAPSQLLLQ